MKEVYTMTEFTIIEQLNNSQIKQLHDLCQEMWWCKGRTMDELLTLLKNCLSIAIVEAASDSLVGYARVLTDEIKYAYIFDVMTAEHNRKKGLGKMLVEAIITHPKLRNVKNFELTCKPDMVGFYRKFSFSKDYGEVISMRYKKRPK